MSNFDLEKAKKTMTAQTRSGEPVEIITTEGRGNYPIVGYIGDEVETQAWRENGKYL